jgi:hypothetical protein
MYDSSTASHLKRSALASPVQSRDDLLCSDSTAVVRFSSATHVDDAGRNRRYPGVRVLFTAERALNPPHRLRLSDDLTGA